MKTKLSALALAMLPFVGVSAVNAASPEIFDDSIIVVYEKNASKFDKMRARSSVGARISDLNRDEIDDKFSNLLDGRIARLNLRGKSVKEALKILRKNPSIKHAEPNYRWTKAVVPNDPGFSNGNLWGLHNTGQNGGTDDADIDAKEAWEITTGDSDIVIGVIDTGIDYNHEDLVANMWTNPGEIPGDGIDNDNNGYIDDVYGIDTINNDSDPMDDDAHGTHVAGTIGAVGDNGIGIVGVNHNVSLAACKFLGPNGGSTAGAIECIDYFTALKNNGVNIKATNNSWGGGGFSQALKNSIDAGGDAGILFLAAAGNSGADNDASPHYPSSYESDALVAVASTNRNDESSTFSYGLTSVDLAAPGSAIVSTTPNNTYSSFSGTSMATPHVAGAAALVWSINPDLTPVEMKALLMNTGDENAWAQGRTVSGKRLNVHNALIEADPTPGFNLGFSTNSAEITAGESFSFTLDIGSVAGFDEEVTLSLDDASGLGSLSSSTAFPGESVSLDITTTSETAWGSYTFTVSGTSGDIQKSASVNVYVYPEGLNEFPYGYQGDPVPTLPNEEDPDNVGVDVVINVPDDITAFGVEAFVDITHTYSGDLVLTLTSPQGTSVTLRSQEGGDTDDIVESYVTSAFNGEVATGDWTLNVLDVFNGDNGQINTWALTLTGIGEVGPTAPNASFSFVEDGLTVEFANESSDVNNDIVSYLWDFGDGITSTEPNPTHVFSETGSYEVSLTATDSEGLSDVSTQTVSVSSALIDVTIGRALLSRFGSLRVNLNYTGSDSDTVMIYRNGELIAETANTGSFRDRARRVNGTSFTYTVCDDTTACSEPVTVQF